MSKAGPEAEIRSPLSRKFLARRVGQCKLGQSLQTRFYMAVNSPRNSNDIITPAVNLFSHHSSSNSIPDFFPVRGLPTQLPRRTATAIATSPRWSWGKDETQNKDDADLQNSDAANALFETRRPAGVSRIQQGILQAPLLTHAALEDRQSAPSPSLPIFCRKQRTVSSRRIAVFFFRKLLLPSNGRKASQHPPLQQRGTRISGRKSGLPNFVNIIATLDTLPPPLSRGP